MTEPGKPESETIKLDQFLKWIGVAQTGGEAKQLIRDGQIEVNGQMELRRGRKLIEGDRVSVAGELYVLGDPEEDAVHDLD
jgi:ribosome-associated protein